MRSRLRGALLAGLAGLLGPVASAAEPEAVARFGSPQAATHLRVLGTTDIAAFAPLLEAFTAAVPELWVDYEQWGSNALFAEAADRIIADIKLIDPARHLRETGVDNALILRNIRHLSQKGTHLLLRVPLIPGFTDDEENIRGIAQFVASLGREIPVELLNFNPMCREKYESLRQRYAFDPNQREIAQERVDALKQILTDHGLRTL